MDLYRRIAAIRTDDDASDLLDEMLDRYGEAPKSVLALLDVALLRAAAARAGISDISQKGSVLKFQLAVFRPEALVAVCGLPKYRQRLTLAAGESPAISLKLKPAPTCWKAPRSWWRICAWPRRSGPRPPGHKDSAPCIGWDIL